MMRLGDHRFRWIIAVACATHLFWSICCFTSSHSPPPNAQHINAIAHLADLFLWVPESARGYVLALFFFAISSLVVIATFRRFRRYELAMLLPQQFVMMFSAFAAIQSTVTGTFADGAPYPWFFIGPDQCWHVFNAVGHTAALLEIFGPWQQKHG